MTTRQHFDGSEAFTNGAPMWRLNHFWRGFVGVASTLARQFECEKPKPPFDSRLFEDFRRAPIRYVVLVANICCGSPDTSHENRGGCGAGSAPASLRASMRVQNFFP